MAEPDSTSAPRMARVSVLFDRGDKLWALLVLAEDFSLYCIAFLFALPRYRLGGGLVVGC